MTEVKALTGKVKFWNESKGYGFIKDDNSETDYFVHVTGVKEKTLYENDEVSFELIDGKKGKNAVNVSLI